MKIKSKDEVRLVALDIIAYEGISELSMNRLAKSLDISKSSLYYYYKSKEELIESIFNHGRKTLISKSFSVDLAKDFSSIIYESYKKWDNIFSDEEINPFLRLVFSLHLTDKKAQEEYNSLYLMIRSQSDIILSSLQFKTVEERNLFSTLFSSFLLVSIEKYIEGEKENFENNLKSFARYVEKNFT